MKFKLPFAIILCASSAYSLGLELTKTEEIQHTIFKHIVAAKLATFDSDHKIVWQGQNPTRVSFLNDYVDNLTDWKSEKNEFEENKTKLLGRTDENSPNFSDTNKALELYKLKSDIEAGYLFDPLSKIEAELSSEYQLVDRKAALFHDIMDLSGPPNRSLFLNSEYGKPHTDNLLTLSRTKKRLKAISQITKKLDLRMVAVPTTNIWSAYTTDGEIYIEVKFFENTRSSTTVIHNNVAWVNSYTGEMSVLWTSIRSNDPTTNLLFLNPKTCRQINNFYLSPLSKKLAPPKETLCAHLNAKLSDGKCYCTDDRETPTQNKLSCKKTAYIGGSGKTTTDKSTFNREIPTSVGNKNHEIKKASKAFLDIVRPGLQGQFIRYYDIHSNMLDTVRSLCESSNIR